MSMDQTLLDQPHHGVSVAAQLLQTLAGKAKDYLLFVKFKLSLLVLSSTLVGFWLASDVVNFSLFYRLALGMFLVIAGANAANQILERKTDALMRRTALRPLPSGRMTVVEGIVFTAVVAPLGFWILHQGVDARVAWLALIAFVLYVLIYTPMKKVSPWCVLVGAFPGAIPAMIGPVAVHHTVTPLSWLLFGIVFLWQFPHFCAIAWIAREDYQKAGLKVLACPKNVYFSAYQILLFSCALLGVSPLMTFFRQAGTYYLIGSVSLSLLLLTSALLFWFKPTNILARRVMGTAILYLPFLFLFMILDKVQVRW